MIGMQQQQITHPKVIDPKNVEETFANGPVNMTTIGSCTTLTFTNVRPDTAQAISGGQVTDHYAVVVARITVPSEIAVEIKNLLNRAIVDQPVGRA